MTVVKKVVLKELGNGGPAFPREDYQCNCSGDQACLGQEGMSMRDYFMAHAPAQPWPIYEPTMPEKPDLGIAIGESGQRYTDWRTAEREENDCWSYENQKAVDAWNDEKKRQYWIQWPRFYADAMLAERQK